MSSARPFAAAGLAALLLAALPFTASAQPVYRIVGPDGRITFSDRPPPEGQGKATTAPVVTMPGSAGESAGGLPFELRTVSSRYPVTLYTRPGCAPCDAGRSYLASRGIPYAERTVTSLEDIEALQRLAGTPTLPFVTIGGQQLKGYSQVEWAQFLDAAGYPKTSQLPATYRAPVPTPLVAAAAARPPAPTGQVAEEPRVAVPVAPSAPAPVNPAGIQF